MRLFSIVLCVLLLVLASILKGGPAAAAALQRPAYTTGDRWVYDLHSSLDGFPGVNESDIGTFLFTLVGRAQVAVLGADQVLVDDVPTSVVRIETRISGFLNGSFSVPGIPGTGTVSGMFSSLATELWETQALLPVASEGTTTYSATISLIVTIDFSATTRMNATTTYASVPPFELGVGESATTGYTTDIRANTTATFSAQTFTSENATSVTANWTREVVRDTTVTVDAGTFAVTEMNQTLTAFPGFAGLVPAEGANETAYYSNSAGNYVRRDAYANGTRVAEMTLQSYSYPTQPGGLSIVQWSLLIAIPIVALLLGLAWYRRRKKSLSSPGGGPPAR